MTVWKTLAALAVAFAGGVAQAATLTQVGTANPGDAVYVDVDVRAPNLSFFDLIFSTPADIGFLGPLDDGSDGTAAFYTPITSFKNVLTSVGVQPTAVTFFGSSFAGGVNYGGATGPSGFRVNGPSGQFERFRLGFVTSPLITPGLKTLDGVLWRAIDDGVTQSFVPTDISIGMTVVPLPAGGVLVLTGLGALALVGRRRRRTA